MHNTIAIAKKELNVYFTTLVGYSGFGAFAFLMGLLFITSLNKFQQYTQYYLAQQKPELLERLNFNDLIITPMLSTGLWMFLFFVPFLTMRLFAEEKSNRTFELLMTTPITSMEIVLGKFLGVSFMIAVMTVIPLIFPLILHAYGSGTGPDSGVEWTPIFCGSFSLFLLGLTFSALGLFVSAFSESQIGAALLTFALLLFCFLLPTIATRIEGDWRTIVEYVTPVTHVARGLQGRFHIRDLIYFVSTTALVLFLTFRVVESHRWR